LGTNRNFKNQKFIEIIEWILLLVLLSVLFLGVLPYVKTSIQRQKARNILRNAKDVRVSAQICFYDTYAKGGEVPVAGKRQILSKSVETEILDTAKSHGRIDTIAYDRRDVKVTDFVYVEDGYIVRYKEVKGKPVWKVYRLDQMIGDS
jgi:ABC-type lipoprotein release transport system permease subunit